MILKNKKASHVGMILSFVIFITFVVFLYVYLNPSIETPESKRSLLNEIGLRIINNISSNFTVLSIQLESNPSENCIQLQSLLLILSQEVESLNRVIAKNEFGNIQETAGNFSNLQIKREDSTNTFFKLYFSPEFESSEETEGSCKVVGEDDYNVGSVDTGKYIFEKNLYNIIERYNNDYEKLKSELRISPGNEFGFEFVLSNGTRSIAMEDVPSSGNIYAEEIPVQYVDEDANILSGFINVKVW